MKKIILFLFLFFLVNCCTAEISSDDANVTVFTLEMLWEMLNQTPKFDNVNYIFYNTEPLPDMFWQTKGHIKAWVDIVGYKRMFEHNGSLYYYGFPEESIDIRYGIDHTIKGEKWWNYNVDYLRAETSELNIKDNVGVARIRVDMKYHKSKIETNPNTGRKRVKKTYYHETQYFSITDENAPTRYIIPPLNQSRVNITYNCNYFNPYYEIQVTTPPGSVGFRVSYGNESVTYYHINYIKKYTDKNYPYFSPIEVNAFEPTDNKIVRYFYDTVTIRAENLTKLDIKCEILTPVGPRTIPIDYYQWLVRYFSIKQVLCYNFLKNIITPVMGLVCLYILYRYFKRIVRMY